MLSIVAAGSAVRITMRGVPQRRAAFTESITFICCASPFDSLPTLPAPVRASRFPRPGRQLLPKHLRSLLATPGNRFKGVSQDQSNFCVDDDPGIVQIDRVPANQLVIWLQNAVLDVVVRCRGVGVLA